MDTKHQLKTNQISFFGKVDINVLVGINKKKKINFFAEIIPSLLAI